MNDQHGAQWRTIGEALRGEAQGITWDGCHKIYLAMDSPAFEALLEWGYEVVEVTDWHDALLMLQEWYGDSCPLRFVQALATVEGDPNDGFTNLIAQGE